MCNRLGIMTTLTKRENKMIMSIARNTFELNEYDNMTLQAKNLDSQAYQKNQDYDNEKTAWIFEDGSALILSSNNDWEINDDYGLHCDHEQL